MISGRTAFWLRSRFGRKIMWLCEEKAKGKTTRFRLPSASTENIIKRKFSKTRRLDNHVIFLSEFSSKQIQNNQRLFQRSVDGKHLMPVFRLKTPVSTFFGVLWNSMVRPKIQNKYSNIHTSCYTGCLA